MVKIEVDIDIAACLIHKYMAARKNAIARISQLENLITIEKDEFDRDIFHLEGERVLLSRMDDINALRAFSKVKNSEALFLFLDVIPDSVRGHHTFDVFTKIFGREELMNALRRTRDTWEKTIIRMMI